jgi:long-chain acyl-CoA synthetase
MTGDARSQVTARLGELFTRWPDQQAIEFAVGSERTWWAWGEVARVCRSIERACDGVSGGVAIALVMAQHPSMVAAELSTLALGRSALLVTPLQPDPMLVNDIEGIAPAVLIARRADWERVGVDDAARHVGVLGLEVGDDGDVRVRHAPDHLLAGPVIDAAVTVLTSGTTGPAKRLPVAWETFVELGGGPTGRAAESGRGALILSLPLVTLGGLLSMTRLVFGGRPMAMMERFDIHVWAAFVKEHRPKVMGAPPPVVKMILDANISPDHFEGVTAYLTSSAPVSPEVAAEFERRYGIPVLLGYGATEFLNSVTGWTGDLWQRFGATKLGSVGRPNAGVRLRVVDAASGVEQPVDAEGVLDVDPPQRAVGLPSGWLRTADRARIDSDGFVWIVGRVDDVIIRGGFKVDLQAVEAALREHPDVTGACAVGLADDRLGQVPAALVTTSHAVSIDELLDWLRARLPAYAVPVRLLRVEAIPQTSTFKPHRVEAIRLFDCLDWPPLAGGSR